MVLKLQHFPCRHYYFSLLLLKGQSSHKKQNLHYKMQVYISYLLFYIVILNLTKDID